MSPGGGGGGQLRLLPGAATSRGDDGLDGKEGGLNSILFIQRIPLATQVSVYFASCCCRLPSPIATHHSLHFFLATEILNSFVQWVCYVSTSALKNGSLNERGVRSSWLEKALSWSKKAPSTEAGLVFCWLSSKEAYLQALWRKLQAAKNAPFVPEMRKRSPKSRCWDSGFYLALFSFADAFRLERLCSCKPNSAHFRSEWSVCDNENRPLRWAVRLLLLL